MEERRKNVKGITLIALVVTVVVLLILASISISTIMGENGLIAKAREAEEQHVISEIKEKFQIDMIQTELNSNNIEETLMEILSGSNGLGIKGIYSILITPTDSEIGIEINCIMEDNNKLYRCTIILNENETSIENINRIKKVEQISQPILLKSTDKEKFENEVSILSEENAFNVVMFSYIQKILYKETKYNIITNENLIKQQYKIIIKEEEEFNDDKKWKDVFVAEKSAYAIDDKGQLWKWECEKSGQSINSVEPTNLSLTNDIQMDSFMDSNSPVIKDVNGKTYILLSSGRFKDVIICLEEMFSLSNKEVGKVKKVIDSKKGEEYYVLDENGDIWYLGNEIKKITEDLQTNFKNIEYLTYRRILALDDNGKVWEANMNIQDSRVINKVSILENQGIKLITECINLNKNFVVTEDNQLIIYDFKNQTITNLNQNNSILNEIGIKEIKSQYLFGTNGKIYFLEDEKVEDLNSKGLCDGRQIIQVNGHTYLDEENGIWLWADNILYKESDKLKGKTLTKQHGCNNVVMIIDSKGYLYKYGYYYYVD